MPPGSTPKSIVIPVAFTEDDSKAVDFVVDSLYKAGDSVHLVHVLRTREPGNEIYHGPVGTSVDVHDPLESRLEEQEIARARQQVREQCGPTCIQKIAAQLEHRYTDSMTKELIDHSLHLFIHATNADGHDIFQTVNSVCEKGFLDNISGKSVHVHAMEEANTPVLVIV